MTILALGGLAVAVNAFAQSRESKVHSASATLPGSDEQSIDLVAFVSAVRPAAGFALVGGRTNSDLVLVLDGTRTMIVKAGTPGEINCPRLAEPFQCAVAADLLGDGVLWFSLLRGVPGATIELPAVTELIGDGRVSLANGWLLPNASVIERSCPEDTSSLAEFIKTFGTDATATFNIARQQIVKVTCAREPTVTTTTVTSTTGTTTVTTTTGTTTETAAP